MTSFKFFRKIANSYRPQKWGWVVIIASWIILIPIVGVFSSFGIFLPSLSAELNATKFEGGTNKSKADLKTSKTLPTYLLSASPYSGSPQSESILHLTRSTSSFSLAPTLSMSSHAKTIHLLLCLPLFLLPGTAISIILFST